MDQIKINGKPLNKKYIKVTQKGLDSLDPYSVPIYQAMEFHRINMVFLTLNAMGNQPFVSGTVASKYSGHVVYEENDFSCHQTVSLLSIYPHHYRLQFLGGVLSFLGKHKLFFHHMVSSNAMVTFVVDQQNCDDFIKRMSANFDLPESHVPFEQEENDELTLFLKKKYPETRATYVEEKIKTYGVILTPDLTLSTFQFTFDQLAGFGERLLSRKDTDDTFSHASAHMMGTDQIALFLITKKSLGMPACHTFPVELLSFHGPHFGDRHSIISRALNCLVQHAIPVLQTGCTGASISIVLPRGRGESAKQALMEVFEGP